MKLLSVIGGAISLNVFQAKLLQKGGQTGSEQVPLETVTSGQFFSFNNK